MGAVRTAESVGRLTFQFGADGSDVALGQHHVRVEDEHILALGSLHAVVAALSGSGVRLCEVLDVELGFVLLAYVTARHLRSVLHDNHLEVLHRLARKAIEQLVHFVRTVVYGDNNAEHHSLSGYYEKKSKKVRSI